MGTHVHRAKPQIKPLSKKPQYQHNDQSPLVDLDDVQEMLDKQREQGSLKERQEAMQQALDEEDLWRVQQQEAYPGEHADLAASRGVKTSGLVIINEPDLIIVETFDPYPEENK